MNNSETQTTFGSRYRTQTNKTKNTGQKSKKIGTTDPSKTLEVYVEDRSVWIVTIYGEKVLL